MSDHPTGQSLRFRVKLDGGADLGNWSKCDGLAVEYEIVEYKEGGENAYIHRIPGRAKYQNIKLTRPLNQDTKKVTAWIASLRVAVERQTAEISALDSEGKAIATWNLDGVSRQMERAFAGRRQQPGGNRVAGTGPQRIPCLR